MPEYFIPFLKCNMQSGSENLKNLQRTIRDDQGFYSLFCHSFKEFDERLDPKRVLSALGWESFRNRFASLFIYYARNRKFPAKTNESELGHIIAFEQKFRRYSVEGHGRLFMLGMYLTFIDIKNKNKDFQTKLEDENLQKLLVKSRIKELKIDWLILALMHFMQELSLNEMEKILSEEDSYLNLYRSLSKEGQRKLTKGYLNYAASIKDDYFFLNSVFDDENFEEEV